MSCAVYAVRPEPGLSETLAAARARGLDAHGAPLFVIEPAAWAVAEGPFDGLLVGSANAVWQGGPKLAQLIRLPVFAVGSRTADAARAAGFAVGAVGRGGLQAVVDTLAPPLRLLRLAGEAHVPLEPPRGLAIVTRVVYRTAPVALSSELTERLGAGGVVMLHSAHAAERFAAECDRLGIDRAKLKLAALGPRVLAAAGEGWKAGRAAPEPTEAALLAMAADMCQE